MAVTRCLTGNGTLVFDWAGKKMVLRRVKGGPGREEDVGAKV